ncbi:MAG: hypothetical protein ACO3RV_07705 [Luteolibacter sp.]
MKIHIKILSGLLSSLLVHAESPKETEVKAAPFTIKHQVSAVAIPRDFQPIMIDASAWTDFEITELTAHGSKVKKGDLLIQFESEKLDEKIEDMQRAIESRAREIQQTESDLRYLKSNSSNHLDALRRAVEIATEEHEYFTKTRRDADAEAADQRLKRAESFLENQSEELRQLELMYSADELTEETEEIILKRQRDRVDAARFELKIETLKHSRVHHVALPREAVNLSIQERDARIALEKYEADAPRQIAKATQQLESLKISQQREQDLLKKIEKDRDLLQISAESEGWFFHGSIEDGRWSVAETSKFLALHNKVPTKRNFAFLVRHDTQLDLIAHLNGATASQLEVGLSGIAWPEGREDLSSDAELVGVASCPDAAGSHMAVFKAKDASKFNPTPLSKVYIHLISYHSDKVLSIPNEALQLEPQGWTVSVKLADGQTEKRIVQRGRVFNGKTEIVSGLSEGQVIILP